MYPGMTGASGRPTSTETRQIVQIAAIKVDEFGNELDTLNILVKPTFNRYLPEFFTELTNIAQSQLDLQAISLSAGIQIFIDFVSD